MGILIIAFAAIVAPVMGAQATAVVSGNMASVVAISTVGEITNWALVAGASPNVNTGAQLKITANGPFTITAKDTMPTDLTKPVGTAGRMVEAVTATGLYVATAAPGKSLATPLEIVGTATEHVTGIDITALSGSTQTLYTADGTYGYSDQLLPLTFKQMVGLTEPRVSASGNSYRIPVEFSITASA